MAEYEANPNGSSREYEWKEIGEGDEDISTLLTEQYRIFLTECRKTN